MQVPLVFFVLRERVFRAANVGVIGVARDQQAPPCINRSLRVTPRTFGEGFTTLHERLQLSHTILRAHFLYPCAIGHSYRTQQRTAPAPSS
jgi:hypothetical protein